MTQQRANILDKFYTGASGRSAGFRYYQNANALRSHFTRMLAYFFTVVQGEIGYCTREWDGNVEADRLATRSGKTLIVMAVGSFMLGAL